MAAGDQHYVALRRDGSVIPWGFAPGALRSEASNIVAIAAGSTHTLTLQSNGTVRLWGSILGSGPSFPETTNGVALALGPGAQHALVLKADGGLIDRGSELIGVANIPPDATNIVAVAAGAHHSLALRADGRVIAWGSGSWGQTNVPAAANNSVAISACWYHSAALRADGTMVVWGNWPFVGSLAPPAEATDVVEIASGGNHLMALRRNGTLVTWGDDSFGQVTPPQGLPLLAGIAGASYASLALAAEGPPAFTKPSIDRKVAAGRTAYFRMFAVGEGPLHYQWTCNETNIPGATNSVLAVANVQPGQSGDIYSVTVTNSLGDVTSAPMVLRVEPLQVTVHPHNPVALPGSSVQFTAKVVGPGPFSYQWHFNGTPLDGETNSSLALADIEMNQTGDYSVSASNVLGTATSLGAALQVVPLLITAQPQGRIVPAGTNITISVGATGQLPIAYQWRFNETNIPGATLDSLMLSIVQLNETGSYSCVLSNSHGAVTSSIAVLKIEPLLISSQPPNQTVPAGTNVTLSVVANGQSPFNYQWQFNGNNLNDATASALELTNVQLNQSGTYSCVISNSYGTVTTSGRTVNVVPLVITTQPADRSVAQGFDVSFTVTALAATPMAYQWQFNGTNLDGATAASLILTNVQPEQAGAYSCIVSNVYGAVASTNAMLSVVPIVISAHPTSRTVNAGYSTTFTVTASGVTPLSYQWQFNGTNIANATSASLTLANIQMNQSGPYSVVVSNAHGSAVSFNAILTVVPFTIRRHPQDWTVVAGGNASFSALFTGAQPFGFEWRFNGTNNVGGNSPSLSLSGIQMSQAGLYHVIITNRFGSLASAPALLTVIPLAISAQPRNAAVLAGSNATFTVSSMGQQPISYQWRFNGVDIAGGTNASLTLTNVPLSAAGNYSVVVGNAFTNITSSAAQLMVDALQITAPPGSRSRFRGGTVTFDVTAQSSEPLGYQWQFNGTDLDGATARSLSLTNIQFADSGFYTVNVSNSLGILSSTGQLAVVAVAAWGEDYTGLTSVPVGLTNVAAIAAGLGHNLVVLPDGSVSGWGGWLNAPDGLSNILAVAGGNAHSVGLQAGGEVVAWGSNTYGQTEVPPGLSNAVALSSHGNHSLALRSDGTVVAWGDNSSGQTNVPAGLSNVVAMAAGNNHCLALRRDGVIVAWGSNDHRQTDVPSTASNVVGVAAGDFHSLALRDDGTVIAWGLNDYGQTNVPAGLSNVVAVACGSVFSLALRADGIMLAWGYNVHGETNVPADLGNVVAMAGGRYHVIALVGDGPLVTTEATMNPARSNSLFTVQVPTQNGRVYQLEYQESLNAANWMALPLVPGNGANQTLIDPDASSSSRFYRVRFW